MVVVVRGKAAQWRAHAEEVVRPGGAAMGAAAEEKGKAAAVMGEVGGETGRERVEMAEVAV